MLPLYAITMIAEQNFRLRSAFPIHVTRNVLLVNRHDLLKRTNDLLNRHSDLLNWHNDLLNCSNDLLNRHPDFYTKSSTQGTGTGSIRARAHG